MGLNICICWGGWCLKQTHGLTYLTHPEASGQLLIPVNGPSSCNNWSLITVYSTSNDDDYDKEVRHASWWQGSLCVCVCVSYGYVKIQHAQTNRQTIDVPARREIEGMLTSEQTFKRLVSHLKRDRQTDRAREPLDRNHVQLVKLRCCYRREKLNPHTKLTSLPRKLEKMLPSIQPQVWCWWGCSCLLSGNLYSFWCFCQRCTQ